ncbi:hypothetical protein [Corynebacterium sp. HMSC28B08]|uniref:hypothetical protein n=1 Tax=Corynebacterium sp. HMSC28B08 TaxID=1581066 RepID=UPI00114CF9CB|nr:hypothetical protein [Corynebacterium sp. HMSC28B08]
MELVPSVFHLHPKEVTVCFAQVVSPHSPRGDCKLTADDKDRKAVIFAAGLLLLDLTMRSLLESTLTNHYNPANGSERIFGF